MRIEEEGHSDSVYNLQSSLSLIVLEYVTFSQ